MGKKSNVTRRSTQLLEGKIDDVKNDITEVKMSVVKIETLMQERAKEDIPNRVRELENFKSKVTVYGSALMVGVTAGVQLLVGYFKGMFT
jgi:hypothetical protein